MDKNEKLFKFIIKVQRNHYKPDVHSFYIKINGGEAYVEGQYGGVYIREFYDDGSENEFHGTAVAATNRLIMLGADYDTIEM